jgi:hypothetical protein
LRLPYQPELVVGQWVQWMIIPTEVRLPPLKLHQSDNPYSGRVEKQLNLRAYCQVALRCGAERLWLVAQNNLVQHHRLETRAGDNRQFTQQSLTVLAEPRLSEPPAPATWLSVAVKPD